MFDFCPPQPKKQFVDTHHLLCYNNSDDLTRKVEDAILKGVLCDHDFRAHHIYSIQTFREECGDTYFSGGGFRVYPPTEVV